MPLDGIESRAEIHDEDPGKGEGHMVAVVKFSRPEFFGQRDYGGNFPEGRYLTAW